MKTHLTAELKEMQKKHWVDAELLLHTSTTNRDLERRKTEPDCTGFRALHKL